MGYTSFTKALIETVLKNYDIKSVVDLGAQNDHSLPDFAMPYTSEWYKEKGIEKSTGNGGYYSIDLNGENDAYVLDLGKPLPEGFIIFAQDGKQICNRMCDLLVDAGTSEHVGTNMQFDWNAIYNCWLNKFNLVREGGIIISENPKSGNWPGHGFNYYTKEFYRQLNSNSDLQTILLDEHAAMHNYTDGWNVVSIMQKKGPKFPTLEVFKKFSIKTS